MTDLQTISQELARYKEAKEKASEGEWIKSMADSSGDLWYIPQIEADCEGELNTEDADFICLAKNTPLEIYCEELIEEVRRLRNE